MDELRHIATFCGSCSCGCPVLYVDETAGPDRRVVFTDDFGAEIRMSLDQLRDVVTGIRAGALDTLV